MWRNLRILVLLLILLFVALNTYFDRVYSTDWDLPLRVTIYPINGDGSAEAEQYIGRLESERFAALEKFFEAEAKHHGLAMERPIQFTSAPQLRDLPPALDRDAKVFSIMSWSLRMRYWAWRSPELPGPAPDIKLFVVYHDPALSPTLAHSLGMQKGLYGVVNVFADRRMSGSNDVITAHELLHTLGAVDKYDPQNSQPLHPVGYAEPTKEPLLPQTHAELMAGRIPVSATDSVTPESLRQVLVGSA
jgi:hypothetical protein